MIIRVMLFFLFLVSTNAWAVRYADDEVYADGASRVAPSVYEPVIGSNTKFNLVRGGVSTDANIGCGIDDIRAVWRTYFNVDYKDAVNHIASNWQGYAATYLIYSSPTMYSLIQSLKKHLQFAQSASMFSCAQIMDMANNSRTNKEQQEVEAEAKRRCVAETSQPDKCNETAKLEEYIQKVNADRARRMDSSQQPLAKYNDYLVKDWDLGASSVGLMERLLGETEVDKSSGRSTKTNPTSHVHAEVLKYKNEYFGKLTSIHRLCGSPGMANSAEFKRALQELRENKDTGGYYEGVEVMTSQRAVAFCSYPPAERTALMHRLSTLMAIGRLAGEMRTIATPLQTAALSAEKQNVLGEPAVKERLERIHLLETSLRSLMYEYEVQERQWNFYKSLEQHLPERSGPR